MTILMALLVATHCITYNRLRIVAVAEFAPQHFHRGHYHALTSSGGPGDPQGPRPGSNVCSSRGRSGDLHASSYVQTVALVAWKKAALGNNHACSSQQAQGPKEFNEIKVQLVLDVKVSSLPCLGYIRTEEDWHSYILHVMIHDFQRDSL